MDSGSSSRSTGIIPLPSVLDFQSPKLTQRYKGTPKEEQPLLLPDPATPDYLSSIENPKPMNHNPSSDHLLWQCHSSPASEKEKG